jgi:DNA gyrase/topoisomerase IV subunit B
MSEDFKILSAREHCRLRPGMYVGSTSKESIEQFVFGKWKTAVYIPALNKMISEILDNSIDEFIRSGGKFATNIDVSIKSNTITVSDNGRGIPQDEIPTPEGDTILRPVAAWTKNNAGTSFGDNRTTIGAHGLGAALVNYMSSSFVGSTWQNGDLLEVVCTDGGLNTTVKKKSREGSGTEVSFSPDFSLFEVSSLQELDTIELIEDRLISLQMAFPEIRFSFNRKRIQVRDMKRYAEMFLEEGASFVLEKTENLSFFFASSNDGFRTNSFINGVNTRQGGTYVDYITNNVIDEVLTLIRKKHKIEVAKSVIKNGVTFVLFARNFTNPKFDSQTKERLTNPASNVKDHHENSGVHDFKHIARRIFAANDIIEPIIAAQLAKKLADDKRNALVAQKKLKKVKVAKHIAANNENAMLALVEGDCVEENTLVETLSGPKKIKDLNTQDFVITHKNRYKRVLSKSFSLKEGIRVNGNIYSKNHRLFVYNVETNAFDVTEVQNIDPKKHKLVRNRIVHNGIENSVHVVRNIKKGGVLITDDVKMVFSNEHEILFLTKELEIITKKYKEIVVGDVIFL